jgi:hypothetical protein
VPIIYSAAWWRGGKGCRSLCVFVCVYFWILMTRRRKKRVYP